jgi:1-deoxy-D-xylulose 5-phosphate reductoisomerase
LWKRLGYRTYVSYTQTLEVINLFKQREDIFPISKCAREMKHLLQIYQVEKEEYVVDNDKSEDSDHEKKLEETTKIELE